MGGRDTPRQCASHYPIILEIDSTMSLRKAIAWTVLWILLALMVNLGVYLELGQVKAMEFMTGYVIEESLSVDNLFVFLLIFSFFKITPIQQRRILNYGIIGVIILRGIMIYLGTELVSHFEWVLYLFGVFLVYSGYKIALGGEIELHPENNTVTRMFKKVFRVKEGNSGNKFFVKGQGHWYATLLFVVLLVIETTDVVFAVDSVPAVFGITTDPFIIFSSNLLAVLGLRSIYFVLEKIHKLFIFVKYGVGVVLAFVGTKMLLDHFYPLSIVISLSVVLGILSASIILSVVWNKVAVEKNTLTEQAIESINNEFRNGALRGENCGKR